jgi:hypothetical protein
MNRSRRAQKTVGSTLLLLGALQFGALPVLAHGKDKACHGVWTACKKAGKKGDALKSCVESIKGGGTVDGVTVGEKDLSSCTASASKQPTTQPSAASGT